MKRLLAKLFRFRQGDEDQPAEGPLAIKTRETRASGMLLLIRDASSLGVYQLHAFEDDAAAAEFVEYWLPAGSEHGAMAFWTAREQAMQLPGLSEKRLAEAVVLIHDAHDERIVEPFSMPDMELAKAWLNEEASKGLNLRRTSLHWAARATIRRDARGRAYFQAVELPAYQPDGADYGDHEQVPSADEVKDAPGSKTRIVRKDGGPAGSFAVEAAIEAREVESELHEPETGDAEKPAPEETTPEETAATEETAAVEESAPEPAPAAGQSRTVSDRLQEIAQGQRWEKREEPFETFGSPPGRF